MRFSQPKQRSTKSLVDLLAITAQERKLNKRIGRIILQTVAEAKTDTAELDIGAPGWTPQRETCLAVRLWKQARPKGMISLTNIRHASLRATPPRSCQTAGGVSQPGTTHV